MAEHLAGIAMKHQSRARGFTIIELLVTLTLVAILLGVAIPIAMTWLDNDKISETESVLQNAISVAKVQALSNPNGISGQTHAVAAICAETLSDGKKTLAVKLVKNTPKGLQSPCGSGSTSLWEAPIQSGVDLSYVDASSKDKPLNYLMFNASGALVSTNCPKGATCPTKSNLKVAAGSGEEKVIKAF
jgi:prepilin-type N-terminal cleavage/methylation domain-containing protein